jgi:hypothetical protein
MRERVGRCESLKEFDVVPILCRKLVEPPPFKPALYQQRERQRSEQ